MVRSAALPRLPHPALPPARLARAERRAPLIIVVEGPSAAGKTTWIARHRAGAAVIAEYSGTGPPAGADVLATSRYWAEANAARWAAAVDAEQRASLVLCDCDPFKLCYTWSLWRIGYSPAREWRAARDASRQMFAGNRLGVADLILVSIPDQGALAARRHADKTRTRRNFDLHRRLAEPIREWYQAVSELDAAAERVRWLHPPNGTHGLARVGPRAPRSGTDLFDRLIDLLPSR